MLRDRLEALRCRYSDERRIAHVQAIAAAMVQLDEVEAYADEQHEALMHDRAQIALLATMQG